MDIVFAGTPRFAEVALRALLDAGHRVPLVLTQPDRGAGRGRRVRPSPVKALAEQRAAEAQNTAQQATALRDGAQAVGTMSAAMRGGRAPSDQPAEAA